MSWNPLRPNSQKDRDKGQTNVSLARLLVGMQGGKELGNKGSAGMPGLPRLDDLNVSHRHCKAA